MTWALGDISVMLPIAGPIVCPLLVEAPPMVDIICKPPPELATWVCITPLVEVEISPFAFKTKFCDFC